MKKKGISLFGISFFVIEIFMFLYYANEESDDAIGRSTKTVQHSKISLEILKQCSSNLAPETYIAKERGHLLCCCHDNSFATGLVLIKTKIPRFFLNKDHPFLTI